MQESKSIRALLRAGKGTAIACLATVALAWFSTPFKAMGAGVFPTTSPDQTYSHPEPSPTSYFGTASAISHDYVAIAAGVGTPADQDRSVYVYSAQTGQFLRTLTQPFPADNPNFYFGSSVAIEGNTIVIGSESEHIPYGGNQLAPNAGAAYVYDLPTGQLLHRLVSDTPQQNRQFGSGVAIHGNHIAVGSLGHAYLFDRATGVQLAQFSPSSFLATQYGVSVGLNDSALIVGGDTSDTSLGAFTGAALVYDLTTHVELRRIIPTDLKAGDNFGGELAVDGRHMITTAARSSGFATRGIAYVFDIESGMQLAKLTSPVKPLVDSFGAGMDIQGNLALIGDPGTRTTFLFDWTTGAVVAQLVPPSLTPDQAFGVSVSLNGKLALVGGAGHGFEYAVIPEPTSMALAIASTALLWRRRSCCDVCPRRQVVVVGCRSERN